jgi:hypothetical protein
VATAAGVVAARHRRTRHRDGQAHPGAGRAAILIARLRRRVPLVGSLLDELKQAADSAATMRRRDWLLATLFAAVNWLADLLCLVAATRAVGISLPVLTLGGAYLAVQVVRQVPITPGGIGVIEASLLVALVSAGAAHAPAAAAVLIYRLVSCWAIVPVGLALWMALQTWGNAAESAAPSAHARRGRANRGRVAGELHARLGRRLVFPKVPGRPPSFAGPRNDPSPTVKQRHDLRQKSILVSRTPKG